MKITLVHGLDIVRLGAMLWKQETTLKILMSLFLLREVLLYVDALSGQHRMHSNGS